MPSKNSRKLYAPKSYYHVYNRGVEKRDIFLDNQDYSVFLSYLKAALSPEEKLEDSELSHLAYQRLRRKNLQKEVELQAYCLMPNHFHLLLYQKTDRGVANLMQSIMTGYVMYFNRKYDRVGSLFQDRYKASLIDNEAYLWHISRYIHLNPKNWKGYDYSSLAYYLDKKNADWVKPNKILSLHTQHKSNYMEFLKDYDDYKEFLKEAGHLLADM